MKNRIRTYTITNKITAADHLVAIQSSDQLKAGIGAVACWPGDYPEEIGFEIIGDPTIVTTENKSEFLMSVEVKASNEHHVVDWAICRMMSCGEEPPGEEYDIVDALFDIMFAYGGGPRPEEMGFTYTNATLR
jgi:hypothetical protein